MIGSATLQTNDLLGDDNELTVYRGSKGELWARPTYEFNDGRFAALSSVPAPQAGEAWTCVARRQTLPEPAECNWPVCGCDPAANKVIEALEDGGALAPQPPPAATEQQVEAACKAFRNEMVAPESWENLCRMAPGAATEIRRAMRAALSAIPVGLDGAGDAGHDEREAYQEKATGTPI